MATLSQALSRKNSMIGIILTLLCIAFAIYLLINHHQEPGFWIGVLVVILLTSNVMITQSK